MFDWSLILGQAVSVAFNLVYFGIVFGVIAVIILDNRNPVKTLAWILMLLFLPFVGLVLYFFFGRSHRRERIISKKGYGRLLKKPLAEFMAQDAMEVPEEYGRLIALMRNTQQALPFEGNRIEAYTQGATFLQALLRAISEARHHIHLEFYIFEDDAVGRLVRDALLQKAQEGVQVRVIYDDVGCWHVPNRFFEEMREGGIEVYAFLKVRFPQFTSKINYRNHRKIVVVDGQVGFVGGMNLAERYVRGVSWGVWRDTQLRVEGKAVHALQAVFLLDWYVVGRTLVTSAVFFPRIDKVAGGTSLVQVVTGSPVGPWREIMQGLIGAIHGARHYIYVQTPYFLPTDSVLLALQTAALSGVDVRLMLPRRADSRLTHYGSCSYLEEMLQAGVKVYFYKAGFLHSKMLVVDDEFSTVGSTNIDFRSFEHNFEVNAFVYDAETTLCLKEIFLADQHSCEQVFLKHWLKRPLRHRVAESVVRLLSPLL